VDWTSKELAALAGLGALRYGLTRINRHGVSLTGVPPASQLTILQSAPALTNTCHGLPTPATSTQVSPEGLQHREVISSPSSGSFSLADPALISHKRKAEDDTGIAQADNTGVLPATPKSKKRRPRTDNRPIGNKKAFGNRLKALNQSRIADMTPKWALRVLEVGRDILPGFLTRDEIQLCSRISRTLTQYKVLKAQIVENIVMAMEHNGRLSRVSAGAKVELIDINIAQVQYWITADVNVVKEILHRWSRWGWLKGFDGIKQVSQKVRNEERWEIIDKLTGTYKENAIDMWCDRHTREALYQVLIDFEDAHPQMAKVAIRDGGY
jgi:hypothetical protein